MPLPPNSDVVVFCDADSPFRAESERLATRLGLACRAPDACTPPPVALQWTAAGLQAVPGFLAGAAPLLLDFTHGQLGHRVRGAGQELLIRAIGGRNQRVLDGTGGFGRDALLMARAGFRVSVCERHPVIHALLEDALQRAARDSRLAADVDRIDLHCADAAAHLRDAPSCSYDVIYLDPMFPERGKSAEVRKEQRLLQQLAGSDPDARELAQLARHHARGRVVVKRPRSAPEVLPGVHTALRGRKIRFDVYLPQRDGRGVVSSRA